MGKHRAPETVEDVWADEIACEAIAIALRDFAVNARIDARKHFDAYEFTIACYYDENADAADRMAKAYEAMRVDLWTTRQGMPAPVVKAVGK